MLLASTDGGAKRNAAGAGEEERRVLAPRVRADDGEQKGEGAGEEEDAAVASRDAELERDAGARESRLKAGRRTTAAGAGRLRAWGEAGSG